MFDILIYWETKSFPVLTRKLNIAFMKFNNNRDQSNWPNILMELRVLNYNTLIVVYCI